MIAAPVLVETRLVARISRGALLVALSDLSEWHARNAIDAFERWNRR